MNPNLHAALLDLQATLEKIQGWAHLLEANQHAGADAINASAKAVSEVSRLLSRTESALNAYQGLAKELKTRYLEDIANASQRYQGLADELKSRYLEDIADASQRFQGVVDSLAGFLETLETFNFPTLFGALQDEVAALSPRLSELQSQLKTFQSTTRQDLAEFKALLKEQSEKVEGLHKKYQGVTESVVGISTTLKAHGQKVEEVLAKVQKNHQETKTALEKAAETRAKQDGRVEETRQKVERLTQLHQESLATLSEALAKQHQDHQQQMAELANEFRQKHNRLAIFLVGLLLIQITTLFFTLQR